jgi:hypothetical protein
MVGNLQSLDFQYQNQNMVVFNVSDPSEPELTETIQDREYGTEYCCLYGDILFQVAKDTPVDATSYVLVYLLAEAGNPEYQGRWSRGNYEELIVFNDYAWVSYDTTIHIYSVDNPIRPEHIGTLDLGFSVHDMCRDGEIIYLSLNDGDYGFACMSIEDPENPEIVGWYDTPGQIDGFKAESGYIYVADKYELGIYDCAELQGIWDLGLSDESHDFGETTIDSSTSWEFTLFNAARQDVDIISISVDSAAFSVQFDDTLTLESNEESSIQVLFKPTESREYIGNLTVHTERRDLNICLSGTGVQLSVSEEPVTPLEFSIQSIYPNPSNSNVTIRYEVPEANEVLLNLYDIQGRLILELASGIHQAGVHELHVQGNQLQSGVYFCKMVSGGLNQSQKMTYLK